MKVQNDLTPLDYVTELKEDWDRMSKNIQDDISPPSTDYSQIYAFVDTDICDDEIILETIIL